MKKKIQVLAAISISFLFAALANAQSANLITGSSAGMVKLGMTVAQVRKAVAPMKLSRTSDGEGVALIAVMKGKTNVMTLYAGEDNRDARINERARIEQIWVWDRSYKTKAGVHPGMLLSSAEKRYGKIEEILMSEIESREFAEFRNHPNGIDFRLQGKDGDAGVYPPRSDRAAIYNRGAYIFSVNVTGRKGTGSRVVRETKFTSVYTDLKTGCKTIGGNDGGHTSTSCKGPAGYQIRYFDSATTLEFIAENKKENFEVHLATEALDYDSRNSKIEWRLADGKPFAVIMRVYEYKQGGEFPMQGKPVGQFLIVKGLKGHQHIDGRIDARRPSANVDARNLADGGYSKAAE